MVSEEQWKRERIFQFGMVPRMLSFPWDFFPPKGVLRVKLIQSNEKHESGEIYGKSGTDETNESDGLQTYHRYQNRLVSI
jgi:hypothetical protein